jgi:hypothetical protein
MKNGSGGAGRQGGGSGEALAAGVAVDQAGVQAIHLHAMRLLMAVVLPEVARGSGDPEGWLDRVEATLLLTVDRLGWQGVGGGCGEMTRAALLGALEETFAGARAMVAVI